ncbi:ATP-binding protein [Chlorogloeopsis fritschii PCC 9212]|uniref:histidine kinase n=1 Tax=Chlorogloeopsis fritschii PCC 6912 TaxID=211165 RepID=A0A3S1A5D3_CHLFR|nr:ATP-binding protein [Chlorogloeopsis fritschii]RUR86562.1 hypothetical protein PCC6912_00050 [Chlorogloeopsis fritschii PCC 6912]
MYLLLIDDNANDRLLIARELRREFPDIELEAIVDIESFEQTLAMNRFDLVITDYQLHWSNGLEILQRVKARYPDCPVIMFTNTGTQEIAVEAMKRGLDDYILKSPKHFVRIPAVVRVTLQRAEERRRAALTEFRLQSLLNQLNVGVFRAKGEQMIEANGAFLQLFGVESLSELDSRQTAALLSAPEALVLHQKRERQVQLSTASGADLWLLVSETLNTINGESVVEGLAEDITGIKRAEAVLKRYADRLQLLQTLDRAILQAETLQNIAQPALESLYGLVLAPLLVVALFDFDAQQATVFAVRSEGEPPLREGERFALSEFGEYDRWLEQRAIELDLTQFSSSTLQRLVEQGICSLVSIPILIEGQMAGILGLGFSEPGSLSDDDMEIITEIANQLAIAVQQARLREELNRYTEELEQLVQDRTQQLEEANLDLETYAYSISHDLREPLRAVQGFARILQEDYADRLDSQGQDLVHRIIKAIERMDSLLQDLLTYNRLNRRNLRLQPVNLTLVVTNAIDQLQVQIQERQAQIAVEAPLLSVQGNFQTLVQVISNLISNAIKFTAAGVQPQVRVWTQKQSKEVGGDRVRLWVEDNGIGVMPQYQERIFGVFERLHGEDSYPGTGIGLAVVRRAIERMGGRVGVESAAGQGSRFWFELLEHDRTKQQD